MGFWFFMLIMNLLIPLLMIVFGRHFSKTAPSEINSLFGYRTTMSMKNKDTWMFAHNHFGKIWYICGLVTLPLSIIGMIPVIGKSSRTIGIVGSIICMIQVVVLIVSIIPTEIALRKTFDKNGLRL